MNERVVIDPEIQHGKPVIRGTRVPITRIVGGLAGGMTIEQIMREYEVTEEDIWAALHYATELIEAQEFHPLPAIAGQGYALLVDEDLPRSTNDLLRQYKHEAIDVRDIGLRGAKDAQIAIHAQSEGLCLVTGDLDFSDIRNYPPREYAGLVVLRLHRTATASFILSLLESFLQQADLVAQMPGKLAIVEAGRVRIRTG